MAPTRHCGQPEARETAEGVSLPELRDYLRCPKLAAADVLWAGMRGGGEAVRQGLMVLLDWASPDLPHRLPGHTFDAALFGGHRRVRGSQMSRQGLSNCRRVRCYRCPNLKVAVY